MRTLWGTVVPLLFLFESFVLAQEALNFEGYVGAFRWVPRTTLQKHDFTFVRLIYNGLIPHYLKKWYTDYPTGDLNLVRNLQRITDIDAAQETQALPIHHPDLFSYPMIYSSEAGQMVLDDADAAALREYLTRG